MTVSKGFVYAVASGEYSDYHVICVCDSEERANAVVEAMRADDEFGYRNDARIEALPYVDSPPKKVTDPGR